MRKLVLFIVGVVVLVSAFLLYERMFSTLPEADPQQFIDPQQQVTQVPDSAQPARTDDQPAATSESSDPQAAADETPNTAPALAAETTAKLPPRMAEPATTGETEEELESFIEWRRQGVRIYFVEADPAPDGRFTTKPFTLLYRDPKDAEHQTTKIEADEASLKFDKELKLGVQTEGSAPQSGRLTGRVVLTSDRGTPDEPGDDLRITTNEMEFQTEAKQISTDDPITIRDAAQEMQVKSVGLTMFYEEKPRPGEPEPAREVTRVEFKRDVEIDLKVAGDPLSAGQTESKEKGTQPMAVRITSKGPGVVDRKKGTFTLNDDVAVVVRQMDGTLRLAVTSDREAKVGYRTEQETKGKKEEKAGAGKTPTLLGRPELQRFEAHGTKVHVRGPDFDAFGQHMNFDREKGRGEITATPVATVTVENQGTLTAPKIVFAQAADGTLKFMEADGAGQLVTRPEPERPEMRVAWKDNLTYHAQASTANATMTGQVTVTQGSDRLTAAKAALAFHVDDKGQRHLDRVDATGNVHASLGSYEVVTQHLSVEMVPTAKTEPATAASPDTKRQQEEEPKTPDKQQQTRIEAERVVLKVASGPDGFEPVDLEAVGNIKISGEGLEDGPLHVSAKSLRMIRHDGAQAIRLQGSPDAPARILTSDGYIEGQTVLYDPSAALAVVEGAGSLRWSSTTDLEGNKLEQPEPLTAVWAKGMSFDGEFLSLRGNARIQQQDSYLAGDTIEVIFLDKIDVRKAQPQASDINKVVARGKAVFEFREPGDQEQIQHLESDQITYDQKRGEILASGPLRYETTGSERVPRTDEPGRSEPQAKPQYVVTKTTVLCEGNLVANRRTETAFFRRNIEATYVRPVGPAGSQRTQQFVLRCHELDVSVMHEGDRKYQLLDARGRAELEAQDFRASGSRISYDEKRDRITIDSEGDQFATLWRQARSGIESGQLQARKFYYYPDTGRFRQLGGRYFELVGTPDKNETPAPKKRPAIPTYRD